jgi:hypothetical protein
MSFKLHAHILSWSGDLPALAKLMCTTGHNSYQACRFCYLRGTYCTTNKHIYYPLSPPKRSTGTHNKPDELPEKTHADYLQDIEDVENADTRTASRQTIKATGINGRSILLELKSVNFPDSFPVDIMHCLFENVAPAMFRHWTGTFLKMEDEFNISNNDWKQIATTIEKNRKNMPYEFGRPLIDITRHSGSLKAEEWTNWVILYSIPLLSGNLDKRLSNKILGGNLPQV